MTEPSGDNTIIPEPTADKPVLTPKSGLDARALGRNVGWSAIFRHPFQNLLGRAPVAPIVDKPAPPVEEYADSPLLPGENVRAWQIRREREKTRREGTNTSSDNNPPAVSETADFIKPAEQSILKPASTPEVAPFNPRFFNQEFVNDMAQTTQGIRIQRNKSQLEEDAAKTTTEMTRQTQTTEAARRRLTADLDAGLGTARKAAKKAGDKNIAVSNEPNISPVSPRRLDNAVTGLEETTAERKARVGEAMRTGHVAQFGGPVDLTDAGRAELAARAAEKAKIKTGTEANQATAETKATPDIAKPTE